MVMGCATRGTINETRRNNLITYTNAETGQFVSVELSDGYVYEQPITRVFRDVEVKGHLFKREMYGSILVAKMSRDEFEQLVGIKLNAPLNGVKSYPPKTIFVSQYCELVRAYVTTLDDNVVAAVKVQAPTQDAALCGTWTSLDDVMAHDINVISEFDKSADESISMKWQ